jgi:hypothetical protein
VTPLELQPQNPIQDSDDAVIDFRDVPLNTPSPKAPKSKLSKKVKYMCVVLVVLVILMVRNPKRCRLDNFTHAS